MAERSSPPKSSAPSSSPGLVKGLGLFDSTALVVGSMIGSGIFIVSADIARQVQSPGLLIMVWVASGVMTLIGALSYGELAAAMPIDRKIGLRSGRSKVVLKQAFADLLPPSIKTRSKMGFGVPISRWFRDELKNERECDDQGGQQRTERRDAGLHPQPPASSPPGAAAHLTHSSVG